MGRCFPISQTRRALIAPGVRAPASVRTNVVSGYAPRGSRLFGAIVAGGVCNALLEGEGKPCVVLQRETKTGDGSISVMAAAAGIVSRWGAKCGAAYESG